MHKLKELYSSPTSELLVIRFEEDVLGNPSGFNPGGGGSYDDDDTNDNGDF